MKYIFTGETKIVNGVILNRIKRLSDGLIGGWIEKEDNLSHDGDCFVYDGARVSGKAMVCGDAEVWLKKYKEIGKKHDYSKKEIKFYGAQIKTLALLK